MATVGDLLVSIGADTSNFEAGVKRTWTLLDQTGRVVSQGGGQFKTFGDTAAEAGEKVMRGSNNATVAVMSLGRGLADAGYGWRFALNNLDPFIAALGQARREAQSTGTSLSRNLVGALTGAGGVALALGIVEFAAARWGDASKKAGEEGIEAAKRQKQALTDLKTEIRDVIAELNNMGGAALFGELQTRMQDFRKLGRDAAPIQRQIADINTKIAAAKKAEEDALKATKGGSGGAGVIPIASTTLPDLEQQKKALVEQLAAIRGSQRELAKGIREVNAELATSTGGRIAQLRHETELMRDRNLITSEYWSKMRELKGLEAEQNALAGKKTPGQKRAETIQEIIDGAGRSISAIREGIGLVYSEAEAAGELLEEKDQAVKSLLEQGLKAADSRVQSVVSDYDRSIREVIQKIENIPSASLPIKVGKDMFENGQAVQELSGYYGELASMVGEVGAQAIMAAMGLAAVKNQTDLLRDSDGDGKPDIPLSIPKNPMPKPKSVREEEDQTAADKFNEAINGLFEAGTAAGFAKEMITEFGDAGAEAFQKLIEGGGNVGQIFRGLVADIGAMVAKATIMAGIMTLLFPTRADKAGGFAGLLSGFLFGGFRAGGGPVLPSRSYIVGENGPELFTPSTGGTIIPNGALGSRVVILQPSVSIDYQGLNVRLDEAKRFGGM